MYFFLFQARPFSFIPIRMGDAWGKSETGRNLERFLIEKEHLLKRAGATTHSKPNQVFFYILIVTVSRNLFTGLILNICSKNFISLEVLYHWSRQ